jgi:hypothetical protein
MALKNVNIIELQAFKTGFDGVKNMLPGQALLVWHWLSLSMTRGIDGTKSGREVEFGEDNKGFTRCTDRFDGFPEDSLRLSMRVGVRCIEGLEQAV